MALKNIVINLLLIAVPLAVWAILWPLNTDNPDDTYGYRIFGIVLLSLLVVFLSIATEFCMSFTKNRYRRWYITIIPAIIMWLLLIFDSSWPNT